MISSVAAGGVESADGELVAAKSSAARRACNRWMMASEDAAAGVESGAGELAAGAAAVDEPEGCPGDDAESSANTRLGIPSVADITRMNFHGHAFIRAPKNDPTVAHRHIERIRATNQPLLAQSPSNQALMPKDSASDFCGLRIETKSGLI